MVEVAFTDPAGRGEDPEHLGVAGQGVGDEDVDAVPRATTGEVLEQQRRDPPTLLIVGDGEGDVGLRPGAERS